MAVLTVGTQTLTLLTGQLVTVSALGAVATGTVTTTALAGFSGAMGLFWQLWAPLSRASAFATTSS